MTTRAMDIGQKELPAGWKWVKLGEVADVNPRRPPGMSRPPEAPITFVPMPSVDGQSGVIAAPEIKRYSEVSKGYTYFENGDVIFAKITPCMQNGKHAVVSGLLGGFAFGSTEFHVIRPRDAVIPEWIHGYVRQPSVLSQAKRHFRGAVGQQRVPGEFLLRLSIPLPPRSEQRRLAAILSEEMAAVEKARKAAQGRLEAAQALPAAYLKEVFPSSEDELPDGWKWVKLGDVCEVITGNTPRRSNASYYGGDIPWVNSRHLGIAKFVCESDEYLTEAGAKQSRMIQTGSVMVTCISGAVRHIGKVAIAGRPLCTNQQINSLVPSRSVDSVFLYHAMHTLKPVLQSLTASTNQNIINKSKLSRVSIALPTLEEQKRVVTELDDKIAGANLAEESIHQELDAIDAMPAALLRKAFSGAL